ncbi:helicase [Cystoisospora suis]|uniref:Helicase n=1 Tax=Cystoisospora suis TaxID=483139 RepID=A0A2C6KZ39_9APIC|nr:helicase [Cystoisospora suis]
MSFNEGFFRILNTPKNTLFFTVKPDNNLRNQEGVLFHSSLPFAFSSCPRYGQNGVFSLFSPSRRDFRHPPREMGFLSGFLAPAHTQRRFRFSYSKGFSSYVNESRGRRRREERRQRIEPPRTFSRHPLNTSTEEERTGYVDSRNERFSALIDQEEDDTSASWKSSFYSRSWLEDRDKQSVRIIPSSAESSCRGPVPPLYSSSTNFVDSTGRYDGNSLLKDTIPRTHDDVCTLRASYATPLLSSVASPSTSLPGQRSDDTLTSPGRQSHAPKKMSSKESGEQASALGIPSTGQRRYPLESFDSKPFSTRESGVSDVSPTTYAEVYVRQISTAPLTEQEERTISLVWRDVLNEKKLCHYLQKYWNIPLFLLRSSRFHHECISYLKNNVSERCPSDFPRNASPSSSLSCLRRPSVEISSVECGRTPGVGRKKRVASKAARHLSFQDPYSFATSWLVRTPHTEDITQSDHPSNLQCTLNNTGDLHGHGRRNEESSSSGDVQNVLPRGRRENVQNSGVCIEEGEAQVGDESRQELSLSFRSRQCLFLLKQLRSVASGCVPPPLDSRRETSTRSTPPVCTPREKMISSTHVPKTTRTDTGQFSTAEEKTLYSDRDENLATTRHQDLYEETFTLLRNLTEDGSEDEKRQRRKGGEGSGHFIDDKDSSKVFPKLLSSKNACRFAPLLTLARLVLSDRYASHLLILKNLRRYADLRMPSSFYPSARQYSRQVFIHAGPPNSGKTAEAVKALLRAPTGCYLAPLRLLAWEVYTRLKREGKKVSLITGQERRICRGQTHVCCTIEAAPLLQRFKCGVIDEAQILASSQRGDAWTRALLGLQVEELHVCSDERAIPLLERMIHSCNDALTIQRYQRLSPLCVEDRPLESLEQLETGDCLICFTRNDVLSLKVKLESLGYNVCLVYGQLPPRVKQAQARRFNEAVRAEYQFEQLTKEDTRQAPDGEEDRLWYDNDVRSLPLLSSTQSQDHRAVRGDHPLCLSGEKGGKSEDREPSRRSSLERVRLDGEEEVDNRGRERRIEECQLEREENFDSDGTHNRITQDKKKPLPLNLRHERLNGTTDFSKKEKEGTAPSFVKSSLSDPAPSANDLSSPSSPSIIQLQDFVTTPASSPSSLFQDFLPPSSSSSSSLQNAVKKQKTVLISTDAVGLGLNLDIRRVVFWKLYKFAGNSEGALRPLTIPEIRQLGGRAGRHGRVYGVEGGRVTCFSTHGAAENSEEDEDFKKVKEALSGSDPLPPLKAAALLPSIPQLLLFCDEVKRLRELDEREGEGVLPSRGSSDGHSSHVVYVEAFKMFCELAEIDEGYFLPRHKLNVMLTAIHALSDLTLSRHQLFTFALAPLPLCTPIAFLKENRSSKHVRKRNNAIDLDPEHDEQTEERLASLEDREIEDGKDDEVQGFSHESEHEPEDGTCEPWEVYDVDVEKDHERSDTLFASQNGVATALGSGMTDSFLRAYRTFALLLGTCSFVPLPPAYVLGQAKAKGERLHEPEDSCSTHAKREQKQEPLEEVDYLGRSTDDTFTRRDRMNEEERKQRCTAGEKGDRRGTTIKDVWKRVGTGEEGQESGYELEDDQLERPRANVRGGALGLQQSTSSSLSDATLPRSFQVSNERREKEEAGDVSVNHHFPGSASPMVTEEGIQRKQKLIKDIAEYLTQLEEHYQVLDVYRWLSMKYPEAFVDIQLAIVSQAHIANRIEVCLNTPWEKLGERGIRDQLHACFSDPHDTAEDVAQLVSLGPLRNEVFSSDRVIKESLKSLDTSFGPGQEYRHLTGVFKMASASQGPMQSISDIINNRVGVSFSDLDEFAPGNFGISTKDREFAENDVCASQQSHFSAFLAALNDSRHLFDGAVNPEKAFSQAVRNVLLEQQSGKRTAIDRGCASVLDCAYTVTPGHLKETDVAPYREGETGRPSFVSGEASLQGASTAIAVNPLECTSGDCREQAETRHRLRTEDSVTLPLREPRDNDPDRDESRYPSGKKSLLSERVDDTERREPGREEKEGIPMEVVFNDLREIAATNSEVGQILKQVWVACHFQPKTQLKTAETKSLNENKLFCTTKSPTQG